MGAGPYKSYWRLPRVYQGVGRLSLGLKTRRRFRSKPERWSIATCTSGIARMAATSKHQRGAKRRRYQGGIVPDICKRRRGMSHANHSQVPRPGTASAVASHQNPRFRVSVRGSDRNIIVYRLNVGSSHIPQSAEAPSSVV